NDQLGRLNALEFFRCTENPLDEFPTSILGLNRLKDLSLSSCQIKSRVPDFSQLSDLEVLFLGGNQFYGPVHYSLLDLYKLGSLNLSSNSITELPDFSTHPNRANMSVRVQDNYIPQSDLDKNIGLFHEYVYLPQKTIPSEQGQVLDILEIETLYNLFESTSGRNWSNKYGWPTTAGAWSSVTSVTDHVSNFNGVSTEGGDVWHVQLPNNNLIGMLTPLSELKELRSIDLSRNDLGGPFESNVIGLTNLLRVNFNSCNLVGGLGSEVETLTNLKVLDLAKNNLFGTLSTDLFKLTHLDTLNLSHNQFSGELVWEYSATTYNLKSIDISNNDLTGKIDEFLRRWPHLQTLNVESNSFFGRLNNGFFYPDLEDLDISNNDYIGSLPEGVLRTSGLSRFDGSHNTFSGNIPQIDAHQLTVIDLSHNMFDALEDDLIGPSVRLDTLRLNDNQLTFGDLEYQSFLFQGKGVPINARIRSFVLEYSPQDSVNTYFDLESLTFSVMQEGDYNTYQWYKNDVPVSGATTSSLTVDESDINISNTFWCEISNTQAPELLLYSRKQYQDAPSASTGNPPTNVFWSIANGDWDDPTIWSHTENGAVANDYPSAGDIVYIIDHQITVESPSICSSLELIVDNANTLLTVDGVRMEVNGELKLTKRSEGHSGNVQIVNGGKIQLVEDIR
ncbi:MAG: hypothetical protein AAF843_10340, partial [Bacteroidota bacterium]